ncbi:hypothetical protein D3C75_945670 [compost metagenome]
MALDFVPGDFYDGLPVCQKSPSHVRGPAGEALPAQYHHPGEYCRQPGGQGLRPGGVRGEEVHREECQLFQGEQSRRTGLAGLLPVSGNLRPGLQRDSDAGRRDLRHERPDYLRRIRRLLVALVGIIQPDAEHWHHHQRYSAFYCQP